MILLMNKHLLILGATGLVGQQLLQQALQDTSVSRVTAPTRKPLPPHPKLDNPIVDFAALPEHADWWKADAVLCAFGTTIRQAGSQADFTRIDHDYVIQAAQLALKAGCQCMVYNSSLGANPNVASFYLRSKGQTEAALQALGFASLNIVRPSLLGGQRTEHRPGEAIALRVFSWLAPLIPRKYRIVPATRVAQCMHRMAVESGAGVHFLESAAILGEG